MYITHLSVYLIKNPQASSKIIILGRFDPKRALQGITSHVGTGSCWSMDQETGQETGHGDDGLNMTLDVSII